VIRCHRIIEDGQTEAFPGFEDPMQVTATITHPEFSGDSHDVIFINVLNEAQRWNDLNDWNKLSWVAVSDVPDMTQAENGGWCAASVVSWSDLFTSKKHALSL
jgi:hypothetical protein